MIPVYENYRDYQPPPYVREAINRLLADLPSHYLSGLQSVVLTNSATIGPGKTRRYGGRKFPQNKSLGRYFPKSRHGAAWIEIVVDNILAAHAIADFALPSFPPLQDGAFGEVLYHEIGHHLDRIIGPLSHGSEATAEAWMRRLACAYGIKHFSNLPESEKVAIKAALEEMRQKAATETRHTA